MAKNTQSSTTLPKSDYTFKIMHLINENNISDAEDIIRVIALNPRVFATVRADLNGLKSVITNEGTLRTIETANSLMEEMVFLVISSIKNGRTSVPIEVFEVEAASSSMPTDTTQTSTNRFSFLSSVNAPASVRAPSATQHGPSDDSTPESSSKSY